MANFASIKSNTKSKKELLRRKKFIKWLKYKKYDCKYLADQTYKYVIEKYDKCHKKEYISQFYNSYTFLNKEKTPEGFTTSTSDSMKNISCINQKVANNMFEIGITQKIITNLGNI